MSILIHGMGVPRACGECPFERETTYICKITQCNTFGSRLQWTRMHNCPLIELPPHGRLGDLDALTHTIERVDWYHQNEEKDMVHGANSFLHQAWYKEQDIYEAIENAETIIPPEGGAEG